MNSETLQFLASLAAVGALIVITHFLGFSRDGVLESEDEARDLLRLSPGGFEPVAIALDARGRAAIARDGNGRLALIVPHGSQFVVRLLAPNARISAQNGVVSISAKELAAPFKLDLGEAAARWARPATSAT